MGALCGVQGNVCPAVNFGADDGFRGARVYQQRYGVAVNLAVDGSAGLPDRAPTWRSCRWAARHLSSTGIPIDRSISRTTQQTDSEAWVWHRSEDAAGEIQIIVQVRRPRFRHGLTK